MRSGVSGLHRRSVRRVLAVAVALLLVADLGAQAILADRDQPRRAAPAGASTTGPVSPAPAAASPGAKADCGPLAAPSFPTSTVAWAQGPGVGIYDAPGAARPARRLANPQPSGAPLVLLVKDRRPGWLKVLLPLRPNGATGWVRAEEVRLLRHDFGILIELGAHRITVYKGGRVFHQEPVGVGTADAPTPCGEYYTKELIKPVDEAGRYDPNGVYGAYAYGLSGFSNVLTSFAGGEAVVGIHGTNDPAGLGKDVSKGCIRISNAGITKLARALPLGVPVDIRP